MNIKALTLSIISVAAAVAAASPAQAQEEGGPKAGGARWHFQPTYYKLEQPNLPKGYNAPAPVAVRSGAVPSRNMLGLDPSYLAKAPAPMAPSLVRPNQAVSAMPSVAAKMKSNSPLEAFQQAFGKPVSSAPVAMVASAPQALPAVPTRANPSKSVSARPIQHRTYSRSTAGTAKLLTPQNRVPAVANYGSLGFTPGAFTPTAGSGSSSSATVSGRIYHAH